MFNVITTISADRDDALELTGKIIRTIGPGMDLGDTHSLVSHGPIEAGLPLLPWYVSVRLTALNMLEAQANVLSTKKRVPTKTLFLYYGEEFMDFSPGKLRMAIPENHAPFSRMPLSLLTQDPHDLIIDHVVSLSGATLEVIEQGSMVPCPQFGCFALRLDIA